MHVLMKFVYEAIRDISSLGGIAFYGLLFLFTLAVQQYIITMKLLFMIIAIMIVTYSIKSVYFKARPDNKAKKKGKNLLEKADLSSFPSVHSARITALGVLGSLTFMNIWLTLLLTAIVIVVCVSRIVLSRHYKADVAAGIILGLIVGYAAFVLIH
ncbi:phosphatase PAP2 family protein [archaeon]|nr:phosphatase PAP2 family protein [archaeon]